jgi:hypothetical protein
VSRHISEIAINHRRMVSKIRACSRRTLFVMPLSSMRHTAVHESPCAKSKRPLLAMPSELGGMLLPLAWHLGLLSSTTWAIFPSFTLSPSVAQR